MKEKATAEPVANEAKEVEARSAKALEKAIADRNTLNKAVEDLKVRDSLTISLDQLREDRDWMRNHGIAHIVGTILEAHENLSAVNELKECAREAGFKAGYNKCLNQVNPFYKSKFTDERSGFHGVDTEVLYVVAVNAYNNLSISAIEDIEKYLEAEDYVDRLRLLYCDPGEEGTVGSSKGDAGTSGAKED
ncbi:hypothetical protein Hanom_Chr04g00317211 [Helianthus anomalus]